MGYPCCGRCCGRHCGISLSMSTHKHLFPCSLVQRLVTKYRSLVLVFPGSLIARAEWDTVLATEPLGEFYSKGLLESFAVLYISLSITKPIVSFGSIAVM